MNRHELGAIVLALGSFGPLAAAAPERKDALGDPLPPAALVRLGTVRLRHAGPVTGLQFSPDGERLLSHGGYTLCLWTTAAGERQQRFAPGSAGVAGAFAGGEARAAFVTPEGLHLIDLTTGRRRRIFAAPDRTLELLELSLDGKYLAAVLADGDRHLVVWETATGEQKGKFRIAQPGVGRLLFSPDGKRLAQVDYNGVIQVRDLAGGEVRCEIQGSHMAQLVMHARLTALAFAPDGKTLATGREDGSVRLWDATTGRERRVLKGGGASLAFAPDGKTLASGGRDGIVRLLDVATGEERRSFAAHAGTVTALAFSADGKKLASGGGGFGSHRIHPRYFRHDYTIRLWDAATGAELPSYGPRGDVVALAYAPDGKLLASAGMDQLIRLWRLPGGEPVRRLEGHQGTVFAVAFSPDGKLLASGGEDKIVRLWDTATGKLRQAMKGHEGGIVSLAFSPDGGTLASAAGENPVRLWDTATGRGRRVLHGHTSGAFAVACSTDGRLLATGGGQGVLLPPFDGVDNSIRLWAARDGRELRRLTGGRNDFAFFALAFSPDGRTLASGCRNGPLRLWEAATGGERLMIDSAGDSLAFAPDGRLLAAASPRSADNAVRVWDTWTGAERRLTGHEGTVYAVAFAPDGRTLASGSADTTVLVWDAAGLGGAKLSTRDVGDEELRRLWTVLAGADAAAAYRAIGELSRAGQAVPYLRERLHPVAVTVDRQRLARLLADLDGDDFAVRQRATAELEKLGELAEPALRKAAASAPPLEVRRRIEDLLEKIDRQALTGDELRALRSVEVLERVGAAEARRVLEALATGTPGAPLTREATAAVERLSRRGWR